MNTTPPQKQSEKPILRPNIYRENPSAQEASGLLPWLPLVMACVLETLWVAAPGNTALGFFALLGFILMTGVSLIVGIVMLIRWEHPHRAALILLSTVFLLPFLTWLLFDGLQLGVLLH